MAPLRLATLVSLAALAGATELTSATWDSAVAGKSVFIKFLAPWCGHCKKLKPDWDKLMAEFKDSKTALIADVDCTAGGKDLCNTHGVRGYPTIKYGDPNNLEDYKGGRTLDALKKFAADNLGPTCGPKNLDLCDDEKKAEITKFQAMSADDLAKEIETKKGEIKTAEDTFSEEVKKLQDTYQQLQKDKDEAVANVKKSGLGLMQAVQAHAKKSAEKSEL